MLMRMIFFAIALQSILCYAAGPSPGAIARLDFATVTGVTAGSVTKFLGIPFAKPP